MFEYSDEGWIEAQEVETRLIRPFFNTDKWCLNENCGGIISLKILRESGKKYGKLAGKLGGKKTYELGLGVHGLTPKQRRENGRKGGEKTNAQKWECLETGFITNPGSLTHYQKARGIDISKNNRRKIS